jgi:hypothetical protein
MNTQHKDRFSERWSAKSQASAPEPSPPEKERENRHNRYQILISLLFIAGCGALLATGCGPASDNTQPRGASEQPAVSRASSTGAASSQKQRQAEFLNRIRQSDPRYQTIEKAVLNENNELGLILSRSVEMDSIPALMRTMLAQMNKEFPGQDITVIAYAPTQPPRRIGTAHLNASTRDMTYTPETQ